MAYRLKTFQVQLSRSRRNFPPVRRVGRRMMLNDLRGASTKGLTRIRNISFY
jgi:hypothetical protein